MQCRPLLEHWPREAQMTPNPDARQAARAGGVAHPRWAHVEQCSCLLGIQQRLVEREREALVKRHDDRATNGTVATLGHDSTTEAR
jgi:hypothetical protein